MTPRHRRARTFSVAAIVAVLVYAGPAHAATALPLADPITDTVQLWSTVLASIEGGAHQIASLFFSQHAETAATENQRQPNEVTQAQSAMAASAGLAVQQLSQAAPSNTATASSIESSTAPSHSPQPTSTSSLAEAPITIGVPVLTNATSEFVTQSQFNSAISALGASVRQLLAEVNTQPTYPIVSGPGAPLSVEAFAPSQRINQLSNVTISNATVSGVSGLAIPDLPDLSGKYLSLTGGSMTGALINSSTASSSFAGALGIGTTTAPFSQLTVTSATPEILGSLSSVVGNTGGSIALRGDYLYMANSTGWGATNSFVIFNVSNPSAPVETSSLNIPYSFPGGLAVAGRYAYITMLNSGALAIYDVSNPKSPTFQGAVSSGDLSGAGSVYVQGRYAYVGGKNGELAIIDISNPATPTEIGTGYVGHGHENSGIIPFVQGKYAYVVDQYNGNLIVFDVSNPANPVSVSSTAAGTYGIYVQGRYAYTLGTSNLMIFDMSDPTSPTEVGSTSSGLSSPGNIYVQGRYAYITSEGNTSLVVMDVSNPAAPVEVSSAVLTGGGFSLQVQGRYAYVTSYGSGNLSVLDLGGGYVQQLEAGGLEAGSLVLRNNLQAVDGDFSGGLSVGNNLNVSGSFSLAASTYNATTSAAKNYSIFSINTASSTGALFTTLYNGNIGVGTSSPYSQFTIWGSDAASTSPFTVVNVASTTVFAVYDNGNATYSGSIFQSSDQRLKSDIIPLDASSSLASILALNPITYNRIDQPGLGVNLGFLAQEVQKVFPQLVSTTSPTALTPGGTLTLNYVGLIAPIVKAIQEVAAVEGSFRQSLIAWLGSAQNGIVDLFAANGHFSGELCVGSTCVTPTQFQAMLAAADSAPSDAAVSSDAATSSEESATDTPPVIKINGENPAVIHVGDTYSDLGATITGPQQILNLGVHTFVNGSLMSLVQIDTSTAATDTIDYVVTDQMGLTSTTTRTVIIEAPSIVPTDASSSTEATSATQ